MLTAMARELVENKRIGESADSIWRSLQQLRPAPSAPAVEPPDSPMADLSEIEIPGITIESTPGAALTEPVTLSCERPSKGTDSTQLSLL